MKTRKELKVKVTLADAELAEAAERSIKQRLGKHHIVDDYQVSLKDRQLETRIFTHNNSPDMVAKDLKRWAVSLDGFQAYMQRPPASR